MKKILLLIMIVANIIQAQNNEENLLKIEMIYVEGGEFIMGTYNGEYKEKPSHTVRLDSFYISKYEITQNLWKAVMGKNPSQFKGNNSPVENVSWYDVQEFINKLNQKTGKQYRLPTEAEWEYAAKGGRKSKHFYYSGSNKSNEVACALGINKTQPVGTKKPNELGIYDMSGNVWEWCQDWYDVKYYEKSPINNPKGPEEGKYRILRGGSWANYVSDVFRVTYRFMLEPSVYGNIVGFRLVHN